MVSRVQPECNCHTCKIVSTQTLLCSMAKSGGLNPLLSVIGENVTSKYFANIKRMRKSFWLDVSMLKHCRVENSSCKNK